VQPKDDRLEDDRLAQIVAGMLNSSSLEELQDDVCEFLILTKSVKGASLKNLLSW